MRKERKKKELGEANGRVQTDTCPAIMGTSLLTNGRLVSVATGRGS